jgi:hypothetical protein
LMIEYWPFLIAANESWDYRIVLCPDFIERAGRRSVLRNCLDPSTALAEGTGSCHVSDERLGTVSLHFKASRLRDGIGDAYDNSGRPLVTIGGIAIRPGLRQGRLDPTALQRALEQALPGIANILAQVRSAETSPKLRLSEKQSYCDDETYFDEVEATLPIIATDDDPNGLRSREVVRSVSGLPKAVFAIALAAMIGVGWLYLDARRPNSTEEPGLRTVTTPVQKSLSDVEADAGWQHDLTLAFEKVGAMLEKQGDLPDALLSYRDNLTIIERLVKLDPGNADWQRDLALSHGRVARVEALLQQSPDNPTLQKDLTWFDGHIATQQR